MHGKVSLLGVVVSSPADTYEKQLLITTMRNSPAQ